MSVYFRVKLFALGGGLWNEHCPEYYVNFVFQNITFDLVSLYNGNINLYGLCNSLVILGEEQH